MGIDGDIIVWCDIDSSLSYGNNNSMPEISLSPSTRVMWRVVVSCEAGESGGRKVNVTSYMSHVTGCNKTTVTECNSTPSTYCNTMPSIATCRAQPNL